MLLISSEGVALCELVICAAPLFLSRHPTAELTVQVLEPWNVKMALLKHYVHYSIYSEFYGHWRKKVKGDPKNINGESYPEP